MEETGLFGDVLSGVEVVVPQPAKRSRSDDSPLPRGAVIVSAEPNDADSVFSEIIEEIDGGLVPHVSAAQRSFLTKLTRSQVRQLAETVLLYWIRAEELHITDTIPASRSLVCQESDLAVNFRIERPRPAYWPDGARSVTFRIAEADADIHEGTAKMLCDDCPVNSICMAQPLIALPQQVFKGYNDDPLMIPDQQDIDEPDDADLFAGTPHIRHDMVLGGLNGAERRRVWSKFTQLRRRFEGGNSEDRPTFTRMERRIRIERAKKLKPVRW